MEESRRRATAGGKERTELGLDGGRGLVWLLLGLRAQQPAAAEQQQAEGGLDEPERPHPRHGTAAAGFEAAAAAAAAPRT